MGYASYTDDILDAKGERGQSLLPQETEESVTAELPKDKVKGKPPVKEVPSYLPIVETMLMRRAESPYHTIEKWTEYVRTCYEKNRGKLPNGNLKNIVATALISLDHKGHARQISLDNSSGEWEVF